MARRPIAVVVVLLAVAVAAPRSSWARTCGTQYLKEHPERFLLPAAKPIGTLQTPASVEVGTRLQFPVAGERLYRWATCRQKGEACYVFVEDEQWDTNGGPILQNDVDGLVALFEQATPADPERGVFQLESEAFGDPPDVDGDPRIYILVLELTDPRMVGFFDPQVATYSDPALRRDLLYLDAGYLRTNRHLARGTLAHEYQHLVLWGQDSDEEDWINEGLSGYAEALTGFPETDVTMVSEFLSQPDQNLILWPVSARSANYGQTYLYAAFLAERFGPGFIRALAAESRNGISGVDEALAGQGSTDTFRDTWEAWIVANCAGSDERLGYQALRGRRAAAYAAPPLPFEGIGGSVTNQWGSVNVIFRQGGNLAVGFVGEQAGRFSVLGYARRGSLGERLVGRAATLGAVGLEAFAVDSLVVVVGRTSPQGPAFTLSGSVLVPTAVAGNAGALPVVPGLGAAYPNPFNGQVVFPLAVSEPGEPSLVLCNLLGQEIRVLAAGSRAAGVYELVWDGVDEKGRPAASGTYLAVLRTGNKRQVQRLTLIR